MVHVADGVSPNDVLEFLGRCASSMSAPLWLQAAQPVVDARVHEGAYDFVADYEAMAQRARNTQSRLMDEVADLRQRLAVAEAKARYADAFGSTSTVPQ